MTCSMVEPRSLISYSLNEDYIVFRGGEHEAASAHLRGTLVLCLSEPLAIKHIRLELTGMSRVWYVEKNHEDNYKEDEG